MELMFVTGEEGSLHSALVLGPWFISLLCLGWLTWTLADVVGHQGPKACMSRVTSLQCMGTGVLAVKESHEQISCFFWHFWSCRRQQQSWGAL